MDDVSTGTLIIILVILVLISAYFSASETGMMTLNRYRLRHLASKGNRQARRVEKLLQRPDRLISLVLIGNNLVNILASALATVIGIRLYGNVGVAIATGILTFVILVFAEVLPKTIAALYPERIAFPSSMLLKPLQKLMAPLVWILNGITRMIMHLFGLRSDISGNNAISKDELRTIVNASNPLISHRYQSMLLSVLDLEIVNVDDIMVPRHDIVGINVNDEWKDILKQLTHSPHGRIVLYRDSLDDAIGMLRVREAYRLMMEKSEFSKEMMLRAADKIYFIPEGTPLNVQLVKFQRNREKVGIVVDEYGDIQGLLSVEDILEEIVGDFTTSMSPSLAEEVIPQSDGSVYIDGSASIRELNKAFGWDLPTSTAKTINGLLLEHIEDIPEVGTHLEFKNYSVDIIEVSNNMIKQVLVRPLNGGGPLPTSSKTKKK